MRRYIQYAWHQNHVRDVLRWHFFAAYHPTWYLCICNGWTCSPWIPHSHKGCTVRHSVLLKMGLVASFTSHQVETLTVTDKELDSFWRVTSFTEWRINKQNTHTNTHTPFPMTSNPLTVTGRDTRAHTCSSTVQSTDLSLLSDWQLKQLPTLSRTLCRC